MASIVSTVGQVVVNIRNFRSEAERSRALRDRLPYARAWYAVRNDAGGWDFGPSKYVGYRGMDADTYLEEAEQNDGRRTEAQLRRWFAVVDIESELFSELSEALTDFLADLGKAPSTAVRISVLESELEGHESVEHDPNDAIVDLILTVTRNLPAEHQQRVRAGLRR